MRDPSSTRRRPPISNWLAEQYFPGAAVACERVRSPTNDVYLVGVGDARYALKVYGAGWRTASEVRWEVDLLGHLAGRGVPVADAVAGRDGEAVRRIALARGAPRLAVLFEWAPGSKPRPRLQPTPGLYRGFGAAVAAMHAAGEGFASPHRRVELEITDLNNVYVAEGTMRCEVLDGYWIDAGTSHDELLEANRQVAGLRRRGLL